MPRSLRDPLARLGVRRRRRSHPLTPRRRAAPQLDRRRAALTTSLASACTWLQVVGAAERLGVDLVDVLGARRARGEPRRLGASPSARRCAAPLPGAAVSLAVIASPATDSAVTSAASSLASFAFCSRLAGASTRAYAGSPCRSTSSAYSWLGALAGDGEDLAGEQGQQDAVLVGGPRRAVLAQERRAGRLLAAEADRAVEQPGHEPLEADRHLEQPAAELGGDPVDHRRAHQRLADRAARPPSPSRCANR